MIFVFVYRGVLTKVNIFCNEQTTRCVLSLEYIYATFDLKINSTKLNEMKNGKI